MLDTLKDLPVFLGKKILFGYGRIAEPTDKIARNVRKDRAVAKQIELQFLFFCDEIGIHKK